MTNTATIHLQAIGSVPAVPLSEIQAGDVLMWNYGAMSVVVSAERVSPKFIELRTVSGDNHREYTQRKRATTLVARVTG